jgi:beta-lactamase regulating signal transducer with metallopeptidase domain
MHFLPAFLETLLHSIWQSLVLAICCVTIFKIKQRVAPSVQKIIYTWVVLLQVVISLVTFLNLKYATVNYVGFINNLGLIKFYEFLNLYAYQIVVGYFLYVSIKLLFVFYNWEHAKFKQPSGFIKPSAEINLFVSQKQLHFGIKKNIQVWFVNNLQAPITYGFFKPIILLPFAISANLSVQEIESVLIHEITHIKNNDYLINLLLILANTFYFFNPFFKYLTAQIKVQREMHCDLQVIHFGYSPVQYANTLLSLAKLHLKLQPIPLHILAPKNELLKRIIFFSLNRNTSFSKLNSHALFILSFVLGFLLFTATTFNIKVKENSKLNLLATINNRLYTAPSYEHISFTAKASIKPIALVKGKVLKPKNFTKASSKISEDVSDISNFDNENFFKQVNYKDTIEQASQFIYELETQNGKETQYYKLENVNGERILTPLLIVNEQKLDSLQKLQIDSIIDAIKTIL